MNFDRILIIEILTFVSVTLACLAVLRNFEAIMAVRRRLTVAAPDRGGGAKGSLIKEKDVRNPFLKWVQASTSISDIKDRGKLQRDLQLAGFEHPAAPVWYVIGRLSAAIGLPIMMLMFQASAPKPMAPSSMLLMTLVFCGLGLVVPRGFVDRRIRQRKEELELEFPDALDLLVVCVDAGLGMEAAFVRVGDEVRKSHPRIAAEFARLAEELGAGRSRPDALRAMAERTDVDGIKSFVSLVIQTDALGVGIAQTLRTFSTEMREHRLLRAEEKAARVPVLMTIPIVACMLPVIIAALLLPASIDIARTLIPAMRGQ
jgi:tight adherence protein C